MPDAARPTELKRPRLWVRFLVITIAPLCLFVVTSWVLFAVKSHGLRMHPDGAAVYGLAFLFYFIGYGSAIAIIDLVLALIPWPKMWCGLALALMATAFLATVGWYHYDL
jgi:hypothetical protein